MIHCTDFLIFRHMSVQFLRNSLPTRHQVKLYVALKEEGSVLDQSNRVLITKIRSINISRVGISRLLTTQHANDAHANEAHLTSSC